MTSNNDGRAWVGLDDMRFWPREFPLSTSAQVTSEGTAVITVLQIPLVTNILTYHSQCDTEEEAAQLAVELTLEWALR